MGLSAAQQNACLNSAPLQSHWNPAAMCVAANSGAPKLFQAQPTRPFPCTPGDNATKSWKTFKNYIYSNNLLLFE